MSNYIVEVRVCAVRGGDWTKSGFHLQGSDFHGDEFVIDGRNVARKMTWEFAVHRAGQYRNAGHRARILQVSSDSDRVVIDWEEPLSKPQVVDRENSHEIFSFRHRGIEVPDMVYNRLLGKYYIRFSTSPNPIDPPDRSIAGNSPTECIDIFLDNRHTPSFAIDRYRVDDRLPAPAASQPATPRITVQQGYEVAGIRPGSAR